MIPNHRNEFPLMLNHYGLTGLAVEVGTHRGEYAEIFLDRWRGRNLYCVDPWSNPPGYQDTIVDEGSDRSYDFILCERRLKQFKKKWIPVTATSIEAAQRLADKQFDFVYIDADHHKVYEDIRIWYPLVKQGGFIAGHDITGRYGDVVKEAVERYFGKDYQTCNGDAVDKYPPLGDCASWYVRKL